MSYNHKFFEAVYNNDYESVVRLSSPYFFNLIRGADLNVKNNNGDTPLILASDKGHKEIAELLVAKGAKSDEVVQSHAEKLDRAWDFLNSDSFHDEIEKAKRARDQARAEEWKRKGSPGLGRLHTCHMCYNTTYGEETVIRLQEKALLHNNILEAQHIEQRSAYRCKRCGKEFCKDCLEKKAPSNEYGGKSCPSCNGLFEIIHG